MLIFKIQFERIILRIFYTYLCLDFVLVILLWIQILYLMSSHNSYDEDKLLSFYEDRKKFNQEAKQIFGVNLHELSRQSNSNNFDKNPFSKDKKTNALEQFFTHIDQTSQKERQQKQNADLRNKLSIINEEMKLEKSKANLWERTKKYIINNFSKRIQLRSVLANSSEASLLSEFITAVDDLLASKEQSQKIQNSFESMLLKDESRREEEQNKSEKLIKFSVQNDRLQIQNQMLKSKIDKLNEERKNRLNSIELGIQSKFAEVESRNEEIKAENTQLMSQITTLKSEISSLKKHQERTTKQSPNKLELEIQFLKEKTRLREDQINSLKSELYNLNISKQDLSIMNDKLKRVVTLAVNMNEQFAQKIKEGVAKNKNSEYYAVEKNETNSKENGLKKHRYKIVKAHSLQKNIRPKNGRFNLS